MAALPVSDGGIRIRPVRVRDARVLGEELALNRAWLQPWEATDPSGPYRMHAKNLIRALLDGERQGHILPYLIEYEGAVAGQLNVSGIAYGSVSSASIGYWISERYAGQGLTPTAVALATDYCFRRLRLHRIEICIRPENAPSLRVVQKLGFRYEGLRRRYIHIDGDWRDHFCFALVAEELPQGVLARWKSGLVDPSWSAVPEADLLAASRPLGS